MQNSSFLVYPSKFSRFYVTSVVVHRFSFIVKWKTLQNKKSAVNFTCETFTWRIGEPNPDEKCTKGLASVIILFCEDSMTHTT